MSLLTIDVGGANELTLRVSQAGHAEPRQVGSRRFTFNGAEYSTIRAELMTVPLVLYPQSATDARTVRTLFANGGQAVCAGDVFNNAGANVTCSGEITDDLIPGLLIANDPWVLSLTLTEVENAGTVGL